MKSTVILLGSSRKNGNTEKIAVEIGKKLNAKTINLSDFKISEFDYEHKNYSDDFLTLISQIIEDYEYIIFATPVYWYTMSGIMKTFFDRLTDLLTIEKEVGRKLRGKKVGVVTSSIGDNLGNNFWLPFEKTFEYLGMTLVLKEHFIEDKITEEELNLIFENSN